MKRKLFFFLFLFLLVVCSDKVFAFNTVKPTDDFYVNDYANILSEETEKYILDRSVSLANQTKAQIVVVTVPNLDGASLEEYATRLFREFGIGDAKENNGLLLLLALDERLMRVEVGYGLEGVLPDAKTGRFQDAYMIPFFKDNNFNEGMLNGYKAFYQELANYYGITGDIDAPIESDAEKLTAEDIAICLFVLFVFVFCNYYWICLYLFEFMHHKQIC